MAFEYRLTALRIPSHPGGAITEPMYIGTLADAGLLVYNWNGSRRISSQLGFSLVVSSRTLVPNFVSYGGYCYFQASNYSV